MRRPQLGAWCARPGQGSWIGGMVCNSDMTTTSDLKQDPRNARKHGPRNTGMIVSSLQEVGAARSIVIDENNVILAGNGVVQAAAEAGIENVQIVEADGNTIVAVRRSGLTPAQKQRLALFDNRSAELAEWDTDVLAELLAEGPSLDGLWGEDELAALLAASSTDLGEFAEPGNGREAEELIACPKCGFQWKG